VDVRQASLTETFFYDDLNRLDYSQLGTSTNLDVAYNSSGNITQKIEGSSYTYDYTTAQAGCTYYAHAQPNAVRNVGGTPYCYDKNGNQSKRAGQTTTWYTSNLPLTINGPSGYSSTFSYGPFRNRWKNVSLYNGNAETTIYIGGLIEKVALNGVTSWRHYISGGTGPVGLYIRKSDGNNAFHYLTRDHLGSIDSIVSSAGTPEVRLSYTAFGNRRKEAGWSGAVPSGDWTQITALTRRGFTTHEMLDNLNLIHMNGRTYDSISARFMASDPFVAHPLNPQSYNAYSYVLNAPVSRIDPSGYQDSDPNPTPEGPEVIVTPGDPNPGSSAKPRLRFPKDFDTSGSPSGPPDEDGSNRRLCCGISEIDQLVRELEIRIEDLLNKEKEARTKGEYDRAAQYSQEADEAMYAIFNLKDTPLAGEPLAPAEPAPRPKGAGELNAEKEGLPTGVTFHADDWPEMPTLPDPK
jgi:RHS repeat-associated protein